MSSKKQYYAHGKLLITGEYAILDGALALAIPTKFGQHLTIDHHANLNEIQWNSLDENGELWFSASYNADLEILHTTDADIAARLQHILNETIKQNTDFHSELVGSLVETKLEFNRNWGLGSSSTLISLISQWANVNPYSVLEKTFKGSGYDIACATARNPIWYSMKNGPQVESIQFNPAWKKNMFFVYLGKKQISRNEIAKYGSLEFDREEFSISITQLTREITTSKNFEEFQGLLSHHEQIISDTLKYPTIHSQLFSSISGTFKSLGAWGGDFVLFLGNEEEVDKIKALGFNTILNWNEMIPNY